MADAEHQHSEASGPAHALERLIFFSDAVFAIAITLLVIEIHVPHLEPGHYSDRDFIVALAQLIPNFIGFFVSFFVIGNFWAGHHRAFDCARHWSPKLLWPNLFMLSAVAAMPFFTAFSAEYYGHRVPMTFYCGWLLLMTLLNMRVVRLATSPEVAGEELTAAKRWAIRRRGIGVALGAATAVGVSLIAPPLGQPALMSIPLWMLLLAQLGPKE